MKLNAVGRKVTLKQDFLAQVEKRLEKMDRYFPGEAVANLTVTVENEDRQVVELSITEGGFSVRSQRTAPSMEVAFDAAADGVMRQVVKNRTRIAAKRGNIAEILEQDFAGEEEENYAVVKEKIFDLRPETVDEAILQMNLIGHTFYMFLNEQTGLVNVVYRRSGGDYGLLIPR